MNHETYTRIQSLTDQAVITQIARIKHLMGENKPERKLFLEM